MGKVQQINRSKFDLEATIRRLLCGFILLPVAITPVEAEESSTLIHPEVASQKQSIKTASSKVAMAVTANPYATDAANEILSKGGSAVDAAIAAQLVLNLVEPQSSGIGGGGFLLHWDQKNRKLLNFNGRETAPKKVDEEHFLLNNKSPMGFYSAVIGGHSVGAPGLLHMLDKAHKAYGILPWNQLFQPAISLAISGFVISPRLYTSLEALKNRSNGAIGKTLYQYLFLPNGKPKPVGSVLKNPELANTLKIIADKGVKAFYQGRVGQNIISAVKRNDLKKGYLSNADLENYQSKVEKPLCKKILTYKLCGSPPPSSGPFTVIEIISLLSKTQGFLGLNYDSVAFYHRFIEASKLAFADRNQYIADPDFVKIPLNALLSNQYLVPRAQQIPLLNASEGKLKAGIIEEADFIQVAATSLPSTTHLSIVDKTGNIVSMTSSIEHAFGSRIMVDGFLLNNQLTDFSFVPRGVDDKKIANRIEPLKRPRSSMAPMIIFDEKNRPILVIGSPGGSWIIPYVAKVIAQHLFLKVPLKEAIENSHVTNVNRNKTAIEIDAPKAIKEGLEEIGHNLYSRPLTSGIHAIEINKNTYLGVADPRREGSASGL